MMKNRLVYTQVEKQLNLENELKRIIAKEDLTANKALIEVTARHLKLDYLDVAAALLLINKPEVMLSDLEHSKLSMEKQKAFELLNAQMVRYRIEVGRTHKVSVRLIKNIFVEEAGVEHGNIGYVDILDDYTILSLPPGMPVEVLQTFKEFKINGIILDIKRLSGAGKKYQAEKSYRRGTRRHYLAANKRNPTPKKEKV